MARKYILALVTGSSLLALAQPALAQDASDDSTSNDDSKEIVVTGTLVRGIAPAGTNVIGVTDKNIQETGAATTAQLLQTIPQLGSFNDFQAPVSASNFVTSNRPNLRNLPGFTTAGASPTLVLVDGHRVVGAGIMVTTPDPDIVPPGAIERVEIVPDGGSAIYGSDAVAGVINFITKKKYDGISVDGHFGFADNYKSWDGSFNAGHSWTGGSAYISYNYSQHGELLGKDRDWVFYPKTTIDGVVATSFQCSPGNVTAGNAVSGIPSAVYGINASGALVAGTTNQCDPSDNASIYPKEHRHSVMAGLNQELSDSLTFDVRAFYTNRDIQFNGGQFTPSTAINFGPSFLASFGFLSSPIFNAHRVTQPSFLQFGETQAVYFAWGPNNANHTRNRLSTWGIAPSFTARLGSNWQLRLLSSYGESDARFDGYNFDQTTLNNAISAGLFNPYLVSASDPVARAAAENFELYGHTRQRQWDTRIVLDGDLFALPGGAVKLAAGLEYNKETFIARNGTIVPGTESTGHTGLVIGGKTIINPYGPLKQVPLSRNVKSAFGELVVPIFGGDNATAGLRELTLSLAGRFDDYSDVGSTFNPKIGLTWKPFEALKIRGSWGRSFVAPSLADDETAAVNTFNVANFPFLKPTAAQVGTTINGVVIPAVNNRQQIVLLGNKPGIESQKAETWSAGADLDVMQGLRISATYWNIKYNKLIALPPFTSSTFYQNFVGTPAIILEPTQAQVDAALASSTQINGASCGANCYVIIDARKQNVSNVKLSGIDLGLNYVTQTGFGSIDFNINANYDLTRNQQASVFSAFVDQIGANASRFRFRSSLGTNVGGLRAQVSLSHNHGYDLSPAVGVGTTQTRVKSFNVVDLFFKYDVSGEGIANGLSFSVNVNNVFDQDPPTYLLQNALTPGTNGFANGRTIGRFVQFGVAKKF